MTDATPHNLEALPDDESGDFSEEHQDTTFADETAGGPEHAEEPESPDGRAGMD
ncbi:hypothetical protein [Dactylosporangium sp. NPDC000521]|uniref:hypothetical protein n=1 Tax=Dactylosporangium sp. NPDC000521 TaxID=3363975 RepID=UPI0036885200